MRQAIKKTRIISMCSDLAAYVVEIYNRESGIFIEKWGMGENNYHQGWLQILRVEKTYLSTFKGFSTSIGLQS